MAVLALSTSLADLRGRLGRIVVGFDRSGGPVTAEDVRGAGAMAVILRDALQPNLLQTLENTPVLVHAGPFGNIAHGNSSVVADLIGIHTGDYLITEAGFGADMGAERFFNIKCRVSGLVPDAAVVVTTVRALKAHSGAHRIVAGRPLPPALLEENPDEVRVGGANLVKQVQNVLLHGVTPVVAVNAFPGDHPSEYDAIREIAASLGVRCAVTSHFAEGGAGAIELAEAVAEAAEEPSEFRLLYPTGATLRDKIEAVATRVYGADGVDYAPAAAGARPARDSGFGDLRSASPRPTCRSRRTRRCKGAPTGWRLPVREVRLSAGAGFAYALCGDMRTMPGLGSHPAAFDIDLDDDGEIVGPLLSEARRLPVPDRGAGQCGNGSEAADSSSSARWTSTVDPVARGVDPSRAEGRHQGAHPHQHGTDQEGQPVPVGERRGGGVARRLQGVSPSGGDGLSTARPRADAICIDTLTMPDPRPASATGHVGHGDRQQGGERGARAQSDEQEGGQHHRDVVGVVPSVVNSSSPTAPPPCPGSARACRRTG